MEIIVEVDEHIAAGHDAVALEFHGDEYGADEGREEREYIDEEPLLPAVGGEHSHAAGDQQNTDEQRQNAPEYRSTVFHIERPFQSGKPKSLFSNGKPKNGVARCFISPARRGACRDSAEEPLSRGRVYPEYNHLLPFPASR